MDSSENVRILSSEFQFWLKHRHKVNVKQEEIETFLSTFFDKNNLDISLQLHKKKHQVPALLKKTKQSSK
jgi:hypothetical protein